MNRYDPSTPRAAAGLTAAAMAAITIGALVVLPAKLEFVNADPYTLAAAKGAAKAPSKVAISPMPIDVPKSANLGEHVQPERATPGAQESREKRYQLSSQSRIHS
jgi:hypothetical protein